MGFWQEILEFLGMSADSLGWAIDLKISRKILFIFILLFIVIVVLVYYNSYYVKPADYSTFWSPN